MQITLSTPVSETLNRNTYFKSNKYIQKDILL